MSSIFEYKPEDITITRATPKGADWSLATPGGEESVPTDNEELRQYWPWRILFVLITLVLVGRLFQLQIAAGKQYRSLAEGNSVRAQRLSADRGIIFDSTGSILARNDKRTAAAITLDRVGAPANLDTLWPALAAIIPLTDQMKQEVHDLIVKKTPGEYILNQNLTKEQYLLLKELSSSTPALSLDEHSIRNYTTGAGLSHILGYVGQVTETDLVNDEYARVDQVGKAGVESSYETELRGVPGIQMSEVDARGRDIGTIADSRNRPATEGSSLRLAINFDWQKKIADALTTAMNDRNTHYPTAAQLGGTVIVMNVKTGQLAAMVSLPEYDNNLFARGITQAEFTTLTNDPGHPLVCRATSGLYPPGSTLKPLIAFGALHDSIVSPSYAFDTPAAITVGNFSFPDWKDHGMTDIRTAIAESNDIFFYMLGGGYNNVKGLGLDRLRETVHWFGLERPTGIDLPSESAGYFLSVERKKKMANEPVYLGDLYHVAIGQGDIGITPLQMAVATSTIANGGTVYAPRLVDSLVNDTNGDPHPIPPTVVSKLPVDPTNIQIVQQGMRQAVTAGSSRPLGALATHVAGKTGTAQFDNNTLTHAWFTGYGPYEDPEYAITVLVEGGGESFDVAVPLAQTVFRIIFNEPLPAAPPAATPANQ